MCTTGIAFVVYAVIGFFGAADFGSNTEGNILENDLGGGAGQGVLNIAMSCERNMVLVRPSLFVAFQVWKPLLFT